MFRGHLSRVLRRAAGHSRPKGMNRLQMGRPVLDLRIENRADQFVLPDIGIEMPEQRGKIVTANAVVEALKIRIHENQYATLLREINVLIRLLWERFQPRNRFSNDSICGPTRRNCSLCAVESFSSMRWPRSVKVR